MTEPLPIPTERMVRAALDYLDYLRVSCRINLNYYIDEEIIAGVYQRMETARAENSQTQTSG